MDFSSILDQIKQAAMMATPFAGARQSPGVQPDPTRPSESQSYGSLGSLDNITTNAKVNRGELPSSQYEFMPNPESPAQMMPSLTPGKMNFQDMQRLMNQSNQSSAGSNPGLGSLDDIILRQSIMNDQMAGRPPQLDTYPPQMPLDSLLDLARSVR